jgi:hypothetical protein
MKRHTFLLTLALVLSSVVSCSKSNSATVDLRGKLINAPEDYYLVVCETGERVWVDVYALQPWWPQLTSAVDAGPGLAPPLYVEMQATVESNGPYGHADKTNRGVVEVKKMPTISATIPVECSQ